MDLYENCTRDELLVVIQKLKEDNDCLRNQIQKGKDSCACENDVSQMPLVSRRFKEKYATTILDSLPDMLTVISHSGILVDLVSSEETNHVGASGDGLIGKDISEIVPPEAYENIKKNLDLVVATDEVSVAHHDLWVEDKLHHYENRIFPLDDSYVLCMCRDITESVNSQQELELAYHRMKAAEKIASLSYWHFYQDTEELEEYMVIPQVFGSKEIVRCKLDEYLAYVYRDDIPKLVKQLHSLDLDEGNYVEHRAIIQGKTKYFHSRVIRAYEKDGTRIIEGYIQDVTYIVEGIHEQETVKYAINNTVEEIYSCSMNGSLEFANSQFISHHNLKGSVSNYKIYNLKYPNDGILQWKELVAQIKKEGGYLKYTMENVLPDGKKRTYEVVSYIIQNHLEKSAIWFFSWDITVRVEQENKIKELNYVMDAILNNIPVYLFVKDPGNEFRYLYWNKAFEEHSHIPASKVLGKTDFEVFPDKNDAEKFRKDDLELLKSQERLEFEETYLTATGETRIVTTSKAIVPTEKKIPLIIGLSWDITDLKNTEKALIAARERAEQSDKLKSAFLANMSHEIRTPLNAIVGFSRLIADSDNLVDKQQFYNIIESNSEMLLQLINDILDISKIEAGTLEFVEAPIDLGDLCRNMYEIHKSRVQENVQLVLDCSHEHLLFVGDSNRISQVMTNLLTNAAKFTHSGEIRFGFSIKNGFLEFIVKDTGIGISEEKVSSIFERFIKLNTFAQGTGLGLSICKMIVEKMGGKISVKSEEGKGSLFRFTLPYQDKTPIKLSQESQKENLFSVPLGGSSDQKTILIAEDVESNYLLLKAFIGKSYKLIRAMDGVEAVEMFENYKPDLILMDIKMPRMDGLEATRKIREISSDVPIIALTAFAFENDKRQVFEVGCNSFLTKPVSKTVLLEKLSQYL